MKEWMIIISTIVSYLFFVVWLVFLVFWPSVYDCWHYGIRAFLTANAIWVYSWFVGGYLSNEIDRLGGGSK